MRANCINTENTFKLAADKDLIIFGKSMYILCGTNYTTCTAFNALQEIQLISYKRYLECTLVQWRLSIYLSLRAQVAVGTFFMISPVIKSKEDKVIFI